MPPDPAAWRWNASLIGARFHNEHTTAAFQDSSIHYWHIQTITIAELDLTVARGVRPGLAVEALIPLRLIRSRIRHEDVDRRPYTLVYPDYHHRNETPVRLADPTLSLHIVRAGKVWNVAGRAGVSIPIGRTEPNPFALGQLGLPHEHFQFGTGTWGPVLVLAVGRQMGRTALTTTAFAHMTLAENAHGYRAGNRYSVNATLAHSLVRAWGGSAGLDLTREEAEHWDERLEEEGNLGRTDALLSLGVGHGLGSAGTAALTLSIPVYSKVRGEQGNQPLALALSFSR